MIITEKLSETRMLWISFIATVLLTIIFQILVNQFGLVLLDALSDSTEVRIAISTMSEQQRQIHAWMTGTLDIAYPMAYGALFIGSAYKFFPSKGFLLAVPAILCIPVDLIEGVVQILALMGLVDWTQLKEFLTPLKNLLFVAGALLTISGWAKWIFLMASSTRQE